MGEEKDSAGFGPIGASQTAGAPEPTRRPPPPRTAIAAMAAAMPSVAESSYTESVIQELVGNILDEALDSLERAEAVLALKSYLQTEWDDVAAHVGVTGRSLQIIAGIVKLRGTFRESLRSRRLGLRHGAALVRLADHDAAAERLHTYLLANPDVGGEDALRLAGLMVREPDLDPELARRQLGDDVRRRLVLRGMTDTADHAGPPVALMNLRTAVDALAALNLRVLDAPTRAAVALELAESAKIIARLQQILRADPA